jgi:hypothetical protein
MKQRHPKNLLELESVEKYLALTDHSSVAWAYHRKVSWVVVKTRGGVCIAVVDRSF